MASSNGEAKVTCGCIALAVAALIALVAFRYYVLTPSGWGF
jgi:hypothetical protein